MCTWADRLVLLNWTGSRAKQRGTPCTGYTWTSVRPKAASPTLNVWEKGDKWHQLVQERWGIPSRIWLHKGHLEAAWIARSVHRADKSTMQEILHVAFLPGFPWVPEADFRLTHCHLSWQHNVLFCELKDGLPAVAVFRCSSEHPEVLWGHQALDLSSAYVWDCRKKSCDFQDTFETGHKGST